MSRFFSLLVLLSLSCTAAIAQSSYWENLLLNDRAKALKEVRETYGSNATIEHFLSRQIILTENGNLNTDEQFMADFLEYPEAPYYLYALWNKTYVFTNYLSNGFNSGNVKNIDLAYNKKYTDPTMREDLTYLKAITRRHYNDFDGFRQLSNAVQGIREWQFCGVFENMNGGGLDRIYGPETLAVSTTPFEANSNGKVNWYNSTASTNEAYISFSNNLEYGSGVNYAQTFFNNPVEREVYVRIGCSSKFKIWLNDALIMENSLEQKTDMDAYIVKIKLPKGNNRLLFKLADRSDFPYFIVKLTDAEGNMLNDINYSNLAMEYPKMDVDQLSPQMITSKYETFFLQKISEHPNDFFYKYCLFYTYMRNSKYNEAKEVIAPLFEQFPKSSLLRYMMIEVYSLEDENLKMQELRDNLILEDPDYHVSMSYKFADVQGLFRMSQSEMEEFMQDYAAIWNDDLITVSTKFILALRLEDRKNIAAYLDQLMKIAQERGSVNLLRTYIPFYNTLLNNPAKYNKLLLAATKKYYDYNLNQKLMVSYDEQQKYDKVIATMKLEMNRLDSEIGPLFDLTNYLHYREKYQESMTYIDKALEFFPYSFKAMELKGDAYLQMGKLEEAINWYKKSLIYNSENISLRSKIQDIKGEKPILEKYKIQDVYQFIKENRNKGTVNNYGYTILLDESVVELFEDAGGKARYTMAIEITSEQGAEYLKEYELGLYGNYSVIKSEIVKKNGSVSPGDREGSTIIFTDLEPKDVIYIDYQVSFSGYGRFFRDFDDRYNLAGGNPITKSCFTLIAPKLKQIQYKVVNIDVPCTTTFDGDYAIYNWNIENFAGLPKDEDYMPSIQDLDAMLHISTISKWSDISNWYSDLVRPQLEENKVTDQAFATIFPNGTEKLTDDQKASAIYYYIMNGFKYSSVSFRQSGYVPQKPSTTITTKLGDCKDFSALFVVLAKKAGLNANMVLCLTADMGQNTMVLPNKDFNHCIVKVLINGEEQFLELTDKYLPYKALPQTLINATILEIPYMSDENAEVQIKKLSNIKRVENSYYFNADVHISSTVQKYKITASLNGSSRSHVSEILDEPNEEVRKTELSELYQYTMDPKVTIDSIYDINNKKEINPLTYSMNLEIDEKLNKIGNYKIWKVPTIMDAYNEDIITWDKRAYPIEYVQYEQSDKYEMTYNVYLDEEGEFTEIPANKMFTYKNHSYSWTYVKVGPKHLKITVVAKVGLDNISPEEYPAFKEYVTKVLEANDELIGFK